jgi:hypothetical protein
VGNGARAGSFGMKEQDRGKLISSNKIAYITG